MAELKRVFSKAIMNKDMDERLVPNGQYRDALNIQIATSDGSDVGSVQTLMGNTKKETMASVNGAYTVPVSSTCVGSIAAPDRDKIYYFVESGSVATTGVSNSLKKDYIIEYDALTSKHKYVFVDIYQRSDQTNAAVGSAATDDDAAVLVDYISISAPDTINKTGIRIGMTVAGTIGGVTYTHADNLIVTDIKYNSGSTSWFIYLELDGATWSGYSASGVALEFEAPRVLNFSRNSIITGINILDSFIYWTDNLHEPKKINIDRSIVGTGGTEYLVGGGGLGYNLATTSTTNGTFEGDTDYFHTRVVVDKAYYSEEVNRFEVVTRADKKRAIYVTEENITVIKKAPTQPLTIDAYTTSVDRINSSGVSNPVSTSHTHSYTSETPEDEFQDVTFNTQVDFREGDIVIIVRASETTLPTSFSDYDIRAEVVESNVNGPDDIYSTGFKLRILSRSNSLPNTEDTYYVRLDDVNPLFEFKFPRFSYRYKYQDGEYSTFAPWSSIAFLPGSYEYLPKKGYNLGMVNKIRSMDLTRYFGGEGFMPKDVVEIDLLYKETNSPTVYTVKTIKKSDGDPVWPDLLNGSGDKRGKFTLTTDMVHAVVPSNQILRPWDNVPRKALAQEISANRLIYGNYLQNYTVLNDPIIKVGISSDDIQGITSDPAMPSVKSLRTYQVGVVFSDGYGRETPVLTNENASISVPKNACGKRNRLSCNISSNSAIPNWAKYYSYYVKETSVEYQNLSMDRWYDAWDGNIWLSFPSSDRNKINEESFLELKSQHGLNKAVTEKARYKVLAIENEAPDFVKTTNVSLGVLLNSNNSVGSTSGAYPVVDGTSFNIAKSAFEAVFGNDLHVITPDNLGLRFFGGDNISKEYDVRRLTLDGTAYTISIRRKFGEDIAFTSTNNSFSGAIDDLRVQLLDRKVENKPEFDGRFFVKIFKDETLNQYVLLNQGEPQYIVSNQWALGYLNNNGYDPATLYPGGIISPGASYLPGSGGDQYTSLNLHHHPTEKAHHVNTFGQTQYTWGKGNDQDTAFMVEAASLKGNPIGAINDRTSTYGDEAENFWNGVANNKQFFIDAATAFSWNGREDNRPGRHGGQLNTDSDGIDPQYIHSIFTNDQGQDAADDLGPMNLEDISNMKPKKGQPSRGIWGSTSQYSFMDISWCGMGEGYDSSTGWNGQATPVPHKLSDVGGNEYQDAWKFIDELTSYGTKFRFQLDPEQVIYTVIDQPHPTAQVLGNGLNTELGYNNTNVYAQNTTNKTGAWGIRNYVHGSGAGSQNRQFKGSNLRQRWTIAVEPPIGSGVLNGYNPIHGTNATTLASDDNYRRAIRHDLGPTPDDVTNNPKNDVIEILEPYYDTDINDNFSDKPGVWETEPKESVDVDIYYQASGLIPIKLDATTNEELLPIGSTFVLNKVVEQVADFSAVDSVAPLAPYLEQVTHTVTSWVSGSKIGISPAVGAITSVTPGIFDLYSSAFSNIRFTRPDGYEITLATDAPITAGDISMGFVNDNIPFKAHYLSWNNCWAFGNGVESDRVRDDFNAPQLDNGVKASSVLAGQLREERRKHGLIWSGIYNSTSGVNDTNQFIAAESITKDLNPVYGSIQALLNKDTRLIMFCEDKVLRADTNKDLLFNADGSSQLVGSNKVVGSAVPYQGDYGIATNPESMVTTPYQTYFTDATRGHVLALSTEGIRSISDIGMRDYFGDLLKSYAWRSLGTFDARKSEYNLTISKKYADNQIIPHEHTTISYSEISKGWVSFKSFTPQSGLSINNDYYTFDKGHIYKHHDNDSRNNFYGTQYTSDVTVLFNDQPNTIKSFATINYEGTQAKVSDFDTESVNWYNGAYSSNSGITSSTTTDGEYFNINSSTGWYVDNVTTNLQTCGNIEFKNKEGKWFGFPVGEDMGSGSGDTVKDNKGEATVQGIGLASIAHSDENATTSIVVTVEDNAGDGWEGGETGVALENSRWTCDTASLAAVAGGTVGSNDIVNLKVTSIVNGVYTGYALSASNMKLGGFGSGPGVSGNVYTVNNETHVTMNTYPNADNPGIEFGDIQTITFTDLGIAGDPNNVVNVAVKFTPGATWPTIDSTYYIDIDDKDGVSDKPLRDGCLQVDHTYFGSGVSTVSVESIADITTTQLSVGSTTAGETGITNKHSGSSLKAGIPEKIASYTFTRVGTSYYNIPSIKWHNLGEYESYYYHILTPTFSGSQVTSFVVDLYYTPPISGPLLLDPDSFCNLGHRASILYNAYTPEVVSEDGAINTFSIEPRNANAAGSIPASAIGGTFNLKIQGTSGAGCILTASRKSDGFTYDFFGNYTNAETSKDVILTSTGLHNEELRIPENTSEDDIEYTVTLAGGPIEGVTSDITGLGENGAEYTILQSGIVEVQSKADSQEHKGNTFTTDTTSIPKLFAGNSYVTGKFKEIRSVLRGAHAAGATTLKLSRIPRGVRAGMYVLNPFGQTSGVTNAIKHLTKVVSVDKNKIVISQALQAPGLTDNSDLSFVPNNASVRPFEVTVTKGGSEPNITGIKTNVSWKKLVGGLRAGTHNVNGATTSSTTVVVTGTTRGILPGQRVDGVGLVGPDGTTHTYVASVTDINTIVLTDAQSLADATVLSFSAGDGTVASKKGGLETGVSLLHLQAHISVTNTEAKIQGYLHVNEVQNSISLQIYSDLILTQ